MEDRGKGFVMFLRFTAALTLSVAYAAEPVWDLISSNLVRRVPRMLGNGWHRDNEATPAGFSYTDRRNKDFPPPPNAGHGLHGRGVYRREHGLRSHLAKRRGYIYPKVHRRGRDVE